MSDIHENVWLAIGLGNQLKAVSEQMWDAIAMQSHAPTAVLTSCRRPATGAKTPAMTARLRVLHGTPSWAVDCRGNQPVSEQRRYPRAMTEKKPEQQQQTPDKEDGNQTQRGDSGLGQKPTSEGQKRTRAADSPYAQ